MRVIEKLIQSDVAFKEERKIGWGSAEKLSWPISDDNEHYLRSKNV